MDQLIAFIEEALGLGDINDGIAIALFIVIVLIGLVSIFALGVEITLAIKYVRFNRVQNSRGQNGEEIARTLLDKEGLNHIRVSVTGSFLFGNSYSHYFKKVRLRRWTVKKKSISSLAMAAQKSSLAVLDKEGDKDMKTRIVLTPLIYFGPLAFVPLVIFGFALDIIFFHTIGLWSILLSALGLLFYVISFIMSIVVLKTEKKAQEKAIEVMRRDNLATEEEIGMCKELFRLYNIEYINDMVIALLELIYRVLLLIASASSSASSSRD